MDPELLQLILALVNAKGTNTKSDYGRLFDPMLGVLTGTYTAEPQPDTSDDDFLQHAPTFAQIGSDFVPADDIRRSIAASVMDGKPAMDIKKEVYQAIAPKIASGEATDDTSKELAALVDTMTSEWRSYQNAVRKRAATPKDDFFSKAGLPSPEQAQMAAQDYADGVMTQLLGSYRPLTQKAGREVKAQKDLQGEYNLMKGFLGVEARGDAEKVLRPQLPARGAKREKMVQDYIDRLTEARLRKTPKIEGEGTYDLPELMREQRQMMTRSQAQSGRLGEAAKTVVPDRSALVNKQREERLAEIAPLVRDMALRDAQRSNPMMDALLQRALMLRMTGG